MSLICDGLCHRFLCYFPPRKAKYSVFMYSIVSIKISEYCHLRSLSAKESPLFQMLLAQLSVMQYPYLKLATFSSQNLRSTS